MTATFVQNEMEIQFIDSIVDRVIGVPAELPRQVFRPHYRQFLFFTYSNLEGESFWNAVAENGGGEDIFLIFIDPNYRWIREQGGNAYGVLKIENGTHYQDIHGKLLESPTGNSADAFVVTCHKCLVLPASGRWTIYGDRRWDLAIAAFKDEQDRQAFKASALSWLDIQSADDVERYVDFMTGAEARSGFRGEFRRAYGGLDS